VQGGRHKGGDFGEGVEYNNSFIDQTFHFYMPERLSSFDLISIVLSGAFQQKRETREDRWSVQFADDFEVQLMRLLNGEKRNISLIKEYYCFDTEGAFPYSSEVSETLSDLAGHGALVYIMGEPGRIARPMIKYFAKKTLEEGRISQQDYDKLADLGRQLPIKRTVFI